MNNSKDPFAPFAEKMQQEGLSQIVIDTFRYYYEKLLSGDKGLLAESDISPVSDLPDVDTFGSELEELGKAETGKVVMIKLNGGLGTSMGLDRAKSLLEVKNGATFLDIIAQQALHSGFRLLLMNSFATRNDSLAELAKYDNLGKDFPIDFLQHKVPKIDTATSTPARYPEKPALEWCPPGHGDLYTALATSGMLKTLLDCGFKYAFVSNCDNLGAVLEARILGYFISKKLPFMMEVADRTEADKKGGHLACLSSDLSHFVLRESAQCPEQDKSAFQDIQRHRYFNTNNLWLNLVSLNGLIAGGRPLKLPMICNAKTVDPTNPHSAKVFQLETAMGSAISVFEGARAVRVPRTRFAPVKTCEDLLSVRSDATVLTGEYAVIPNPERKFGPPSVHLDPAYYRLIRDMESRFPAGPPSMLECEGLRVVGDVVFGKNVTLKGQVEITNSTDRAQRIPDDTLVEGSLRF